MKQQRRVDPKLQKRAGPSEEGVWEGACGAEGESEVPAPRRRGGWREKSTNTCGREFFLTVTQSITWERPQESLSSFTLE